ncbi:FAD synthase [Mycoplasmopsis lipofaciens]|uniref:FAD synthase n=1 Tax=Mycoplasmopsis lipofaciens TaxID=114884 RepID=UPI0005676F81|nr:riboflavin biosynthesis protein [Mycoplasmopsis lipofaciens]
MLKIYNFKNIPKFNNPIFLLGAFESFHIGHNLLLDKAKELNKKNNNTRDIVLVFFADVENLPKNNKEIFSDLKNRVQEFSNIGFQYAIQLKYNEVGYLQAEDFIKKLVSKQSDYSLIIGKEFKFGFKAQGDYKLLNNLYCDRVYSIEPLKLNNNMKVSTTFLKENLVDGDIDILNTLNVFPYSFSCDIHQDEDVIKIIKHDLLITLHNGVYLVNVEIGELTYFAILQVNFDMSYYLYFIDFKLQSQEYLFARIIVLNKIRLFMKNEKEKINDNDIFVAKNEFIKLISQNKL